MGLAEPQLGSELIGKALIDSWVCVMKFSEYCTMNAECCTLRKKKNGKTLGNNVPFRY